MYYATHGLRNDEMVHFIMSQFYTRCKYIAEERVVLCQPLTEGKIQQEHYFYGLSMVKSPAFKTARVFFLYVVDYNYYYYTRFI